MPAIMAWIVIAQVNQSVARTTSVAISARLNVTRALVHATVNCHYQFSSTSSALNGSGHLAESALHTHSWFFLVQQQCSLWSCLTDSIGCQAIVIPLHPRCCR